MQISVFGFGDFGSLVVKHLTPNNEVLVYDRNHTKTAAITALGAVPVDLARAASADVIILAVTLEVFEDTLRSIAPHIKPGSLVADVTSVKVKPTEMMLRLLPEHCQVLATHPLFGPTSASKGLTGKKIVLDPIRVSNLEEVEEFLTSLGLELVYMKAEEHDKEMAWVHALTFFVGRGLLNINPPQSKLNTHYYDELMDVVNVERTHSLELFNTIQRGNPYAEEMRQKFLQSLSDLEAEIRKKSL